MYGKKDFKFIKQGAESKIYQGKFINRNCILKERFSKKYRHQILDASLTKARIKWEVKNILRCRTVGIRTPAIFSVDVDNGYIFMEEVENSITVRDYIYGLVKNNLQVEKEITVLGEKIGKAIGVMHMNNIIHGDLTTSNMMLQKNESDNEFELVLIDFGLSGNDCSAEDKGVDLYVLERALLSTHPDSEQLFRNIISSYKKFNKNNCKEVISKFEDVRMRGRKRTMIG